MPTKPITGLNSLTTENSPTGGLSNVFSGRVRYAMLDDKTQNKAFKEFGEWSSIGCIFFDKVNQPNPDPQFTTDNFAKPLFPNQNQRASAAANSQRCGFAGATMATVGVCRHYGQA